MKDAPLIYCSAAAGINIKNIFKIVLHKVFDVPVKVPKLSNDGEPITEY